MILTKRSAWWSERERGRKRFHWLSASNHVSLWMEWILGIHKPEYIERTLMKNCSKLFNNESKSQQKRDN